MSIFLEEENSGEERHCRVQEMESSEKRWELWDETGNLQNAGKGGKSEMVVARLWK